MKNKTKNPGKQRLRLYKGALHTKRKLLIAPLDKALQKKHGIKKISVRKGDSVKVIVGDNKNKTGKVQRVDYSSAKVFISDIKYKTSRGQEKMLPFIASNLLITDLVLTDPRRLNSKKLKTPKKDKVV